MKSIINVNIAMFVIYYYDQVVSVCKEAYKRVDCA